METETLAYRQGDTEMLGHLVRPAGSESRPGVVVFHAAPGLDPSVKERAAMLAGLGYVALGADLYGGGKVAGTGEEAMRLMGAVRTRRSCAPGRGRRSTRSRRSPGCGRTRSPPSAIASAAMWRSNWRGAARRSPAS